MFRLAHISDVHLGPLPKVTLRQLASKRITGYVNWHRNRRKHHASDALTVLMEDIFAQAPDHLAITGDLVNLSTDIEIETATAWLQAAGDPENTSLVPGNHDAYVPGAFRKICAAWAHYMAGDDVSQRPLTVKSFPYLRRRGPVALIGVSTANASLPFMATGMFDETEARRLRALLKQAGEEGLFRIILIHHPPVNNAAAWHKRMQGISRFQKVVAEEGAELVLHGHTHLDTLHRIMGKARTVPVLGVPSASEGPSGRRPAAGYNLISIEGANGDWRCTVARHRLDRAGEEIVLSDTIDLHLKV
ncbi:MAG: metallophosphatase [Rhizobiaceae bacterium MnEN-MB40S]|nr:MAG: metallophosphatase [Rhizobiaceae bacterium MnEN-MB40S]